MSSKQCSKCGEWRPLEDFYKHSARKDGRRADCKVCSAAFRSRPASKEYHRRYHLKRHYGLEYEQYEALVSKQDNKCGCCGKVMKKPHVDHCHITGELRGLLCSECNTGIGKLGDSIEGLEQAIRYLKLTQE